MAGGETAQQHCWAVFGSCVVEGCGSKAVEGDGALSFVSAVRLVLQKGWKRGGIQVSGGLMGE